MARIRVERPILADPTSTALLLAGPTAVELWPGVRRLAADESAPAGTTVVVDADIPTWGAAREPARVSIRARAPRRTPMAYVTEFEFSGPGLPNTTGVLTLTYEPAPGHVNATSALLRLDFSPFEGDGRVVDRLRASRALRELATGFLANLAAAAEQRAYAA